MGSPNVRLEPTRAQRRSAEAIMGFFFRAVILGFLVLGLAGCSEDKFEAGVEALDSGDNARAAELFSEAIHSGDLDDGLLPEAYYYRGLAYQHMGQIAKAINDFAAAALARIELETKGGGGE